MIYELHDGLAYWMLALSFATAITAWVLSRLRKPSYQELLQEREWLADCVVHWKYPDGTIVPQSKRQRMFRDLQRLSRSIRKHPDNPNKPETGTLAPPSRSAKSRVTDEDWELYF